MANIFLPIDEDNTSIDSPEVIRINGVCYKKVQLSTEPDTNSWNEVDEDTFNTCEDCEGIHPCQVTYEATYDCELGDFIVEPHYIDTVCESFVGCVETPWFIFDFDSETNQCIYRSLTCDLLDDPICETEEDVCFATGFPTALPDIGTIDCPCPESSSSSSSSSIINCGIITITGDGFPTKVSGFIDFDDIADEGEVSSKAANFADSAAGWNLGATFITNLGPDSSWIPQNPAWPWVCPGGPTEALAVIGNTASTATITAAYAFHTSGDCSRGLHDICHPQSFGVISLLGPGDWLTCITSGWGTFSVVPCVPTTPESSSSSDVITGKATGPRFI